MTVESSSGTVNVGARSAGAVTGTAASEKSADTRAPQSRHGHSRFARTESPNVSCRNRSSRYCRSPTSSELTTDGGSGAARSPRLTRQLRRTEVTSDAVSRPSPAVRRSSSSRPVSADSSNDRCNRPSASQ